MVIMYEVLKTTFKGKKVFITGHTGFKGSWLVKMLSMLGADIQGYALAPKNENDLYNLIDGDRLCHSIINDIRNKEALSNTIKDFQPDFIFHLAAQPLVRESYNSPLETLEINAMGTANLMESLKQLNKSCSIVMITTDKVYHNNEWYYPYRENDRLGGYDIYSSSKACAEIIIDSYRNSFFNLRDYESHKKGFAVARAGNVIGGGDWSADRLIPDIIKALVNNKSISIRYPNAIRPWQHVLEPLAGYLLLAARLQESPLKYSQAYNFGPAVSDNITVEKLVQLAIQKWGTGNYIVEKTNRTSHEAGLLKLDISKVTNELGWLPKMDASKALELSIDWYKSFNSDVDNIVSLTENQIIRFLN